MKETMVEFFATLSLAAILIVSPALGDVNYRTSSRMSPNDYLFGSHGKRGDPLFDSAPVVDLSVDLGIGSDCGRMDFKNTLKAALNNVLDEKYLESAGKDIIGASPLLAACYLSPTWCAILKHSRISADLLAQMRLDQCSFVNKYTDSRVDDFYQERQRCVNRAIKSTNGNVEQAMEQCQDYWGADLKSWAGSNGESSENRLIESSAKWAGVTDPETKRTVSLVQSLVGDTVVSKGNVSVDFGPTQKQTTPRTYLMKLEQQIHSKLCRDILFKVSENGGMRASIDNVVSDSDLRELSGDSENYLIDRQTIRALSFMPERKRNFVCQKVADAMALTLFSNDMSKSLDFLSAKVGANPHLPDNRKAEAERKRLALKDQVETTYAIYKNRSEPLNQILSQINEEGQNYQEELSKQGFSAEKAERKSGQTKAQFMDCADGILCQNQ